MSDSDFSEDEYVPKAKNRKAPAAAAGPSRGAAAAKSAVAASSSQAQAPLAPSAAGNSPAPPRPASASAGPENLEAAAAADAGTEAGPSKPAPKKKKAIEDIYKKKTQLEHILLRPDTYVGSTERQQAKLWVHDGTAMVHRDVSFVPGLYKIFDEILVNASDNKVRDKTMSALDVEVDAERGWVRVWNNGAGVPVEMHKTEKVYVPELIFGHLLTSSNYDDAEKKVTGGRNGYGAKLANIFSTEFVVETADGKRGRSYRQVFKKNMSVIGAPEIKPIAKKTKKKKKKSDEFSDSEEDDDGDLLSGSDWTRVSFKPDLAKFGMERLEEDVVDLMRKRTFDIAGVLGRGCQVSFNGQRVPVRSFSEYVRLYLPSPDTPRASIKVGDRWEIVVAPSDGQFQQVSFVNGICTTKGGTHVGLVVDQIAKALSETLVKRNKGCQAKPFMVKAYLSVFVNAMIENPAFDSQTKETLTLRPSSFGSKCDLPEKFMKQVADAGVAERVLSFATFKQDRALKKTDGAKRARIVGLPKLMDANDAGGRHSEDCTLILTEGDSAKSLVVGGLSVAGRDRFGVFPLRGKLLNVRDASAAAVAGNAEIQNIKQILGLQHGKVYESAKALRYGHLMIMTDQDHDGSHIKGLIMNFFHHFYPSLLKVPGFLLEFITPIVKATKGTREFSFYTLPEYEAWREERGGAPGWKVKYYKGLGTSTEKEAKAYFSRIDSHRKRFVWHDDAEDGGALELAFSKKKIEERKAWLAAVEPGTFLDQSQPEIGYSDFVHRELVLFSRADLERSIPCVVDGFKPGQRKILFCAFKRNLKSDIKVAQLAGYVSEHSAYHHGETSLQSTIVGLAQNFVGSNNINLLVPQGQFGTRLMGGKDAASARYIYTRLDPMARALFHEADDALLDYLNEEGQVIEPKWYVPLIPTVLVNGAEGIGTGWSTFVPNYNPRDLVAGVRALLRGDEPAALEPWYRGFAGKCEEVPSKTSGKSYSLSGIVEIDEEARTVDVVELPVRRWTQDYKEFLETLVKPPEGSGPNARPVLADYREHHTDSTVHFALQAPDGDDRAWNDLTGKTTAGGIDTRLKLSTKISIGNMVLFDAEGRVRKYDSADEILRDFFKLRLDFYSKRRAALIAAAEADALRAANKARFIGSVVDGSLALRGRPAKEVELELEREGYSRLPATRKAGLAAAQALAAAEVEAAAAAEAEEESGPADSGITGEGGPAASAVGRSYEYLLSLPISSLTAEKAADLACAAADAEAEVLRLRAMTPTAMYALDLDNLDEALTVRDAELEADAAKAAAQRSKAVKAAAKARKERAAGKGKGKGKPKKKAAWSDDEESDDGEDDDDEGFASFDDDDGSDGDAPSGSAATYNPRPRAPGKRAVGASSASVSAVSAAAAPSGSTAAAVEKEGDEAESGKAAAAAPAAAADASAAPPAPSPPAAEAGSLLDRLAGRLGSLTVRPDALAAALSPGGGAPAAKAKNASAAAGDDGGEEEPTAAAATAPSPSKRPAKAAPAARKKAPAKKAAASSDDDDEEESDDGEEEDPYELSGSDDDFDAPKSKKKASTTAAKAAAAPKKKPTTARKPAAAAKPATSAAVTIEDSDDDEGRAPAAAAAAATSAETETAGAAAAAPRRAAAAAGRARVKAAVASDDDDESEPESEEESEDEDSDFE